MPQRERRRRGSRSPEERGPRAHRRHERMTRRSCRRSARRGSVGEGAWMRLQRPWSQAPRVEPRALRGGAEPRCRSAWSSAAARDSPGPGAPRPVGCGGGSGREEFRPEGLRWRSDPWSRREGRAGFSMRGARCVVSARTRAHMRTSLAITGTWGTERSLDERCSGDLARPRTEERCDPPPRIPMRQRSPDPAR